MNGNLDHGLIGWRKQLAARPVDTRISANSRKRGGGLTGRGDGGPRARETHRRSRVLQTDSRAASELLSPANQTDYPSQRGIHNSSRRFSVSLLPMTVQ